MNILVINNSYPSSYYPSAYCFVHEQCKLLQKNGHAVVVMDVDLRSIKWKRKLGYYVDEFDGLKVYRLAVPLFTRAPMPIAVLNYLSALLGNFIFKKISADGFSPDIIHAHFAVGSGAIALALKNKYSIPYAITEHSSLIHTQVPKIVKGSLKCYYNADIVIAVSKCLKRSIIQCGIEKDVCIIPNIIRAERFYINKMLTKYNKFTFLTIGRLIPSKGIGRLLEAFGKMSQKFSNIQLIIAGTGSEKKRLNSQAIKLGIAEKVIFSGMIPHSELVNLYNQCHCFVLPSEHETFGMVYVEALACGLPVIATRCGGPEDFVNTCNGILIDDANGDKLYTAMEQIYLKINQGFYNSYKIREEIINKYNEQSIYNQLKKIYEEILDKNEDLSICSWRQR